MGKTQGAIDEIVSQTAKLSCVIHKRTFTNIDCTRNHNNITVCDRSGNMTHSAVSYEHYWATVCKTVRPMLSDRRPVCRVCDVDALWPNGWTDQDQTWYAGRR